MNVPCFVDASVIVCARDSREPAKQARAAEWLDRLWAEQLGRTSVQAIAEAYGIFRRLSSASAEDAWHRVSGYFSWQPIAMDEELLRRAREVEARYRIAWWDATVVAAAQLQDCGLLLTEDLPDGTVFGTVIARNPSTLAVREPIAAYDVPRIALRHRPRGRPRKLVTVTN